MQVMRNDVSKKSTILSVERAIILLKRMSEEETPIGVRDMARKIGYNPSTVQKLVNSLEVQGLVQQDEQTDGYELSLEIFRLGASVLNKLNLHQVARSNLRSLMESTGESSYLAMLTPDLKWYVFVDKVESTHLLRWTADLGAWRPLNCTAEGKAMLACLPDEHLDDLSEEGVFRQSTPNSIVEVSDLRQELETVRENQCAYSDEEFAEGVRAIAAPIFDYSNKVIGAVSVVGPTLRLTEDKIDRLCGELSSEGEKISKKLGFQKDQGFYE